MVIRPQDLRPVARLSMLEDIIWHNFMNVRDLITEIRSEEKGGEEGVRAEEMAQDGDSRITFASAVST